VKWLTTPLVLPRWVLLGCLPYIGLGALWLFERA
jgi:hypothetical protein